MKQTSKDIVTETNETDKLLQKDMEKDSKKSTTNALYISLGICFFYATASMTLSIVNKYVLTSYDFKYPCTLFVIQMTCSLIVLKTCHIRNLIDLPKITPALLLQVLPVAICNVCNTLAGFLGLRFVNIPMFLCIRRTTTAFTLLSEYIIMHKVAPKNIRGSVYIIAIGAIVAGLDTFNSYLVGYAYTFLNNCFTAAYLALMNRFCKTTGIKAFGLMFLNALVSLPMTLLCLPIIDPINQLSSYQYWSSYQFLFGLLSSSLLGVVLVYATTLCSTYNSPVATSVTGNVKDLVLTVLGYLLFQTSLSKFAVVGIFISFSGSFIYSYFKLQSNNH